MPLRKKLRSWWASASGVEELKALDTSAAEPARKIDVPTNGDTQILNGTYAITMSPSGMVETPRLTAEGRLVRQITFQVAWAPQALMGV